MLLRVGLLPFFLIGCGKPVTPNSDDASAKTPVTNPTGPIPVDIDSANKSLAETNVAIETSSGTQPASPTMQDSARSLQQIAKLIERKDFKAAETELFDRLILDPSDGEAMELQADLNWARGERMAAIDGYQELIAIELRAKSDEKYKPSRTAYQKLIDALLQTGRPYSAVATLRKAILDYPRFTQFHYDIAGISAAIGIVNDAIPSLQTLIKFGLADFKTLAVAANPLRVRPDETYIDELLRRFPDVDELQFGRAVAEFSELHFEESADILQRFIEQRPDMLDAQLLYGRTLQETGEVERFQTWISQLPADHRTGAQYWYLVGRNAQNQSRHEDASWAFRQCLADSPSDLRAMTDWYRSLKALGRNEDAEQAAKTIELENSFRGGIDSFFENGADSQRSAIEIAETIAAMGRPWEAEAWARLAVGLQNDTDPKIKSRYLAIRKTLNPQTPWQLPGTSLAERIEPDQISDDQNLLQGSGAIGGKSFSAAAQSAVTPRFVDQASSRGYQHSSLEGVVPAKYGFWMHQTVGGGIGVVDFDLDGWPDLASAILNGDPMQSDSDVNQLHRNLDGQFVRCDAAAGYADTEYGQGIAIADFNGDGFPDLFDANIGENRYYQNNGDGTFTDLTKQIGMTGRRWSTSVAMADFNGDGNLDIFEVCYCDGMEPYSKHCGGDSSVAMCSPLYYSAKSDLLWYGDSSGRIHDASGVMNEAAMLGRGLGVVAGFFDEEPGLDCYVSNDMTANHLWSPQTSGDRGLQLRETATTRGIGLSGRSEAQASMGIAAADPDFDGDIDFYVTHFAADYNTFYEQVTAGSWVDRTVQTGLQRPTLQWLGFGTQWVDLTNHGNLDLFVANGHVNQPANQDIAYEMPPQLFRLGSDRRWTELESTKLGRYFETTHLGRTVAIADFNRDALNDLVVTHLTEPTSLLINQTAGEQAAEESPTPVGQSIRFRLVATGSQRDATGAKLSLTIDGTARTVQLLAGDGYMCSNENVIHVGTGGSGNVTDAQVTWPTGHVTHYGDLPGSAEYLLVEDQEAFEFAR